MTQPEPPRSYILKGLEEVGLPDHVSWFPQTLGWKILAMILLLVVMYFSYKKRVLGGLIVIVWKH